MTAPRMPRAHPAVLDSLLQALVEWSARVLAIGLLGVVASCGALLMGCGGHDPAEDRRDTDPVDCRATPERCR